MDTKDTFQRAAKAADIPDGQAKVFEVGDRRLAICNVEGEFFAIDDLCTHDGGPLGDGELVDHEIECPRHGARFDVRNGKALCLPAILPVISYKVEVRNAEVWVSIPIEVGGTA